MKVIDAHTGLILKPGDIVPLPGPGSTPEGSLRRMRRPGLRNYYRVLRINPGIFSASMDALTVVNGLKRIDRVPLTVRWTHPGYPLQHVAFVPS